MVRHVRTKSVKSTSVQVVYLIHVQEIKPWPPSQSLRYLRSVLIQWENGDRSSGSTNSVVPSLQSVSGEGKIEFNDSFRLPVTLLRDVSVKARDADTFQKNCLEFNLYEQRRDKAGQLLATAIIDLADYGVIKEPISTRVPMNCKRSFGNTDQPILFFKIQLVGKGRTSSSTRDTLSKEVSLDKDGGESEEYMEESELASYTDDDVSSHSSLALTSSTSESSGGLTSQNEENGKDTVRKDGTGQDNKEHALTSKLESKRTDIIPQITTHDNLKGNSSCSSSIDISCEMGSPLNGEVIEKLHSSNSRVQVNEEDDERDCEDKNFMENSAISSMENSHEKKQKEIGQESQKLDEGKQSNSSSLDANGVKFPVQSDTHYLSAENQSVKGNGLKSDGPKKVKSVRSTLDPGRSNELVSVIHHTDMKEIGGLGDSQNGAGSLRSNERKDSKGYSNNTSHILGSRIQQLEHRIKKLEGELRETAAIEAALYSVVADHGSSTIKIHAPARRLSRLYLYACRESSHSRRASAARSAVSGLVVVAKACGHDVPRMTFWLSNSIVLRAIVSQSIGDPELSISAGDAKGNSKISFKWKESSPSEEDNISGSCGSFCDWEDPLTFISALEKVEAWIFSRIVESIWWQTLIPHMQCAVIKAIDRGMSSSFKENYGRTSSLGDKEKESFSLELWRKAFKDARERLCPVRAGGHECGCLPVLARLIMKQSVARLDVAMFNAILRESADELPTDPVSDPISDPEVLPIPAGKTSFGAGAQLKNAIGNWSRLLTDIYGMDDDSTDDENDHDDTDGMQEKSFKSFHLLNALSDLMMLPKDMLLSKSIRKEVCPAFGAPLIKRVLDNFVPDEFCLDQIPDVVLEALDSEDTLEDMEEFVTNYPSPAAPTVYLPPTAVSIACLIGDLGNQSKLRRNGSSVLRKSYTSDDELDELNSPLASIFLDGSDTSHISTKPGWTSKENYNRNALRYELLQDVWMDSV